MDLTKNIRQYYMRLIKQCLSLAQLEKNHTMWSLAIESYKQTDNSVFTDIGSCSDGNSGNPINKHSVGATTPTPSVPAHANTSHTAADTISTTPNAAPDPTPATTA